MGENSVREALKMVYSLVDTANAYVNKRACGRGIKASGMERRNVFMGSSASAIMTSQLGSIITNPAYTQLLGIEPALQPAQVKALVIDDAPLDYEHFSLGTKVLVGYFIRGSIFISRDEIRRYKIQGGSTSIIRRASYWAANATRICDSWTPP